MAVNIHITIIELNALHTKRQNLFQELDAVIHLLMEDRKSGSAGMPRPISYAVFCLKKKKKNYIIASKIAKTIQEFFIPTGSWARYIFPPVPSSSFKIYSFWSSMLF